MSLVGVRIVDLHDEKHGMVLRPFGNGLYSILMDNDEGVRYLRTGMGRFVTEHVWERDHCK